VIFILSRWGTLNNYEEARNAGTEPSFSMHSSCIPGFLINPLEVIQRSRCHFSRLS
jgi:hypothetical protein